MPAHEPMHKARSFAPSIIFIIVANLLPLAGVLWYDWSVFALLVLFWIENVITGLFNVPRIILAQGGGPTGGVEINGRVVQLARFGMAGFFCVHYGIFTLGHGAFVFGMMSGDDANIRYEVSDVFSVISSYGLGWAILALVVSHGFSFFYNYLLRGEYKTAFFMNQMKRPYNRVIILHMTILFGGFLVSLMREPLAGLVVLLGIKIFIDIKAHVLEHQGKDMPILPVRRQRVSKLVSDINHPDQ